MLTALASGQTIRDAARSAGIGERTATRRLTDPKFRRQVAELRAGMIGRALGQLADGMAAADTVKLGAARSLPELSVKLRESVELEERLADWERRFTDDKGQS